MSSAHFYFRSWSHELTQRLKDLWWQGLSGTECAARLGITNAMAVIEKAAREGFRRDPAREDADDDGEGAAPADKDALHLSDADNHQCRWITSDGRHSDPAICGKPTIKRSSWCKEHHKLVYYPAPKPKARKR